MTELMDRLAKVVGYQQRIDRLARVAYEVIATETFGVPPGKQDKQDRSYTGIPQQSRGVEWEQLPDYAKRTWRKVVERILAEDRGER